MKVGKYTYASLLVFFILIVSIRFVQYYLNNEFLIYSFASCNPELVNCFVSDCSSDETNDCDISPYFKVKIPAYNSPSCLLEHNCDNFICEEEKGCEAIYCSEETMEDGERCSGTDDTNSLVYPDQSGE